ncbi:hypothetical protein BIT28_06580 [Photobacterium proteolyticum]|uniref:FHA domain-containing protein n=1 Tax=Photobacterium proteolyticum TaxID=1903952 RepID=A0A1Q9GEL7_9GAMM|nr:FHA domain-containing protein [Photobacterium proteolyticum]OLQ72847.1 hypothetical protein BIT28_06580 [Photobacterium proteolyticum]
MPLSLRIISSPDGEPISEWNKNFPEEGGSIGRSYGTTMQLSDASRAISGTHAIINRGSRGYQVMDVSTNGLFINGNSQPLGKNNSSSLNDGDVLDLGQYRLMVSCFVPEQATVKPSFAAESVSLGDWGDDPFGTEPPVQELPVQPDAVRREPELSFTALADSAFSDNAANVELDPFANMDPEVLPTVEHMHIDQLKDDSFDDDPFSDEQSELLASVPFVTGIQPARGNSLTQSSTNPEPTTLPPVGMDPQQLLMMQARQQEMMIQAAEMALGRLMDEMAPTSLEEMFKDLVRPGFFSPKPDYWEMYKRYFLRQQDNQEWQLKFKAYFSESLRIKQSLGEK